MTSIGDNAFGGCSGLTSVISETKDPFDIPDAFAGRYDQTVLYVPVGTIDKYKACEGWQEFKNIVEIEMSDAIPGDANGDGTVNVTDIVEIVNAILGKPSANFNKEAADVNGDGEVNVTDIVSVVNIILSDPVSARELLGDDEDE